MKKYFLSLLLLPMLGANAQQKQSLKDLLYGGKLKLDSNAVIRKGDDLTARIDTSTVKALAPEESKTTAANAEASTNALSAAAAVNADTTVANAGTGGKESMVPAKSNTKIWREYTDSLIATLKTEVLPSKKIKRGTYYLMVAYEIGLDGRVTIPDVVSTPENTFLQEQVKDRLTFSAPQLLPVLDSSNKPRKVKRKYNFNITKD